MIRLSVLGSVTLTGADGAEQIEVVSQPKRLALLTYLAAAEPLRFHRRDSLLAVFWPEVTDSRARAALRRALHFLRSHLGDDTIVGRGDEVGVASGVWCDVAAFRTALGDDHPEGALELYRGDLLGGFFVPSAPEFERWLDSERQRLRATAATAAWTMADREDRLGNGRAAAQWARRATWLAPDDEAAFQRFVGLLDRVGERATALRAYDEFVTRMREDYGLDPSPETRALVDGVRQRRDSLRAVAVAEPEPPGEMNPNLIAVLPFTVRGNAELAYLREGLVDLLSAQLDRAGEIRTVEPHALLQCVRAMAPGEIVTRQARVVAERFGAGRFVVGSLVAAGERLRARATLHETNGSSEIRADAQAEGEGEIFGIVDDLVRGLLAQHTTSVGSHLARLAAATTGSLPALKAYLHGEYALRAGRNRDALDAYARAVTEDPAFALGRYRLAAARIACGMVQEAHDASESAGELRSRLLPHTRTLLDAQAAWLSGSVDEAESLYHDIVRERPEDVEAWYHLGHLQFEFNIYRGRSPLAARRALERTVAYDPKHVRALTQLIRIAALERRADDLDAKVERLLELSPAADQALAMRAVRAFALSDGVAEGVVMVAMGGAKPGALASVLADVVTCADDPACAIRVLHRIRELTPASALGALPDVVGAYLAVAAGNRDEGIRMLATLEASHRRAALEHRALLLTHPFLTATDGELTAMRAALEAWEPPGQAEDRVLTPSAVHAGLHPVLRWYLIGLVSARMGDFAGALECADRCEASVVPAHATHMERNLAAGVRARVSLTRQGPQAALEHLERLRLDRWIALAGSSPIYALARERFLRAEALLALGRRDEATGWLQGVGQRSPYEVVYRAAVRSLLAQPMP